MLHKLYNQLINKPLLIIVVAFAVIGPTFLLTAFGFNGNTTNRNERAVVPFEEVPERGLVWADLKADPKSPLCGGELLVVVNREGSAQGCTHGPDPAPEDINIVEQSSDDRLLSTVTNLRSRLDSIVTESGLNAQGIQCIGDGVAGARVELIYAVASDKVDRFDTIKTYIPDYAANIEHIYTQSAIVHGAEDADMRFVTTNSSSGDCSIVINKVVLTPTGDDSFGNTISELRAAGFNRAERKYLTFVDASAYCGVATIYNDSKNTQDNANNGRWPMYSRVDSGCWGFENSVEAHEVMHTLGAVQQDAPHPTPGSHCSDDYDRMCYKDSSTVTMTYPCGAENESRFDCNGDDYFNPKPQAGSYLANYWNTANSAFLVLTEGDDSTPDTQAPTVRLTSPGEGAVLSGVSAISADASDNKAVAQVEFLINGQVVATDTSSPYSFQWDTTTVEDGSFTVLAKATDTSGLSTESASVNVNVDNSVPVDSEPPVVSITSPADGETVPGSFTINISATDNVAVLEVKLRVNGTVVASDSEAPYEFPLSLANGVYTLTAEASDGIQTGSSTPITVDVSDGPPADTEAPTAPSNLSAEAISYNEVELAWEASSDNVSVTGYRIRRDSKTIATVADTAFRDTTVLPNSSYTYSIVAIDAAGNISPSSNPATVTTPDEPDTQAPSAPTNLTANVVSSSQINLGWSKSTDNIGISYYTIFRNGSQIATTTSTSFGDASLQPSTTYTYTVQAVDAAGNVSENSNQVSATTDIVISDTTPPSAPMNLRVTKDRGKNTDLAWNESTDNIGVTGYYVYRKEASTLGFTRIGTSTTTEVSDSNAHPKYDWQYYVRAFDAAGNLSENSNTISN